jgi:hypothetical protein
MASQIEDDIVPRSTRHQEVKSTDWRQEASTCGKKLDLVPSYEEILDSLDSSSQLPSSSRMRRSTASPSIVSQSQPVRSTRIRHPYFNTQKSPIVTIDLEDFEDLVEEKHLHLIPSSMPSPSKR